MAGVCAGGDTWAVASIFSATGAGVVKGRCLSMRANLAAEALKGFARSASAELLITRFVSEPSGGVGLLKELHTPDKTCKALCCCAIPII